MERRPRTHRDCPSGSAGRACPRASASLAAYKDKPVITVCRVGFRSAQAARLLAGAGFTQASNLEGGMQAWRNAGY